MNIEPLEDLFGIMVNEDGRQIKVAVVKPNALNGEDFQAIPTLDGDVVVVAVNVNYLAVMEDLSQKNPEEFIRGLTHDIIEVAETCQPELTLEEL